MGTISEVEMGINDNLGTLYSINTISGIIFILIGILIFFKKSKRLLIILFILLLLGDLFMFFNNIHGGLFVYSKGFLELKFIALLIISLPVVLDYEDDENTIQLKK